MANNNAGNNGTGAYRLPAPTPEQAAAIRRSNERERARRSRNLYVETSKGYMQMERQKALEALARKLSPYKGSKNNRNAAIRALETTRTSAQANRNSTRRKIQKWGQGVTNVTSNTNKELYKKMRQYYISELNKVMNKRTGNSRSVKLLEKLSGMSRALGRGRARAGIYSAYGARGLAKAAVAPVRGAALTGRASTGLLQRMKVKAFAMRKKRAPSNYNASVAWKAHVLDLRRKQDNANRKVANIESRFKQLSRYGATNNSLQRIRSDLNGAKEAAARAKNLANNARRRKTIPALFPGAPAMPKSGTVNRKTALVAQLPLAGGPSRRTSVAQLAGLFQGPAPTVQGNFAGRGRAPENVNMFYNAESNNNAASVANNAALAALQTQAAPGPRRWFRNPLARRRN